MKPMRTFAVVPALPAPLERLRELAYNLRWSWDHASISVFRRLDNDLWESTGHNPVLMLGRINQESLEAAANDEGFMAELDVAYRQYQAYVSSHSTWYSRAHGGAVPGPLVAYFSAEFGVTECLSIFAGGLGILAGDTLKSASDLGVPMVAVGLLYQQGYFRQYLNDAGWQQEAYEQNDFHNLPLVLERGPDGAPVTISVEMPGRLVMAQVWRAQVGRVPLYLLDTNIAINSPNDRDITDHLYGGDSENRIKQEILLGIGGHRALLTLGIEPEVYHLNEGHAAFLTLERTRRLMGLHGLSFAEAREAAAPGLVFTTHTPVPAGHDRFSLDLIGRYMGEYASRLGISWQEFTGLGHEQQCADNAFCMTALALRMAGASNGVSDLHGQVSRQMWKEIWPGLPVDEVPIRHVTNGVHFRSWISNAVDELYNRYLGPRWADTPADETVWARMERVPAEELWRAHERRRERLVAFVRRAVRAQLEARGAPLSEIEDADELLDPTALTIGFARRFAVYKRANLLFRDVERLAKLIGNSERPVQIILAGKAHPKDDAGKQLIQQILSLSRHDPFRHRLVFVENYDLTVARYLVQGCDVWLNTPRRPMEASGTSGMKAAANGGLNLSTLDGWWDEAWRTHDVHTKTIGWAIGRGEDYADLATQDQVEAEALYDLLEEDVVPTFYDRGPDRLPRQWIGRMKTSIEALNHSFNTHRMVRQYTEEFYLPGAEHFSQLIADDGTRARVLAAWKDRVRTGWGRVSIQAVDTGPEDEIQVGTRFRVRARVRLGELGPEDVSVQLYMGRVAPGGEIVQARAIPMHAFRQDEDGHYVFEAAGVDVKQSGLHGYTVRVLPSHPDLLSPYVPGLITWASQEG